MNRRIILAAALVLAAGCGTTTPRATGTATAPGPTVTVTASAEEPTASPANPTTSPGGPTTSPGAPSPGESRLVAGRYQPLWPFSGPAEVRAWQASYRAGGHQPWHLDARRTALAFTRDYLGFRDLDRAMPAKVEGAHARVRVGFLSEERPLPMSAATVHLVRYGQGPDAPWEVVGTDDTTLTLTTPRYGAGVRPPVKVGGRITGVDENIRVKALQPWSERSLGETDGLPAGGDRRPWSTRLSFTARPGQTVTIVAWTGGHIADVELFAVTGVTVSAGRS
ncbi:hypothetical protein Ssi03_27400 [Sphaerisporangium siamense]|uniref:Uncharacterized protein n=1 Tax=Sphaerisporangium siamense TaxID=795645 RepID=A0A7W7D4H0_9ACTN|nr:hypothetical protein [Sphaerisporangium siamense]MBB4699931.1 hypothetical protein [Sphaerisporangium siamense]GII84750.1 hypothetical protein Ssi03_27400 [Sphaerisporangium siamense]